MERRIERNLVKTLIPLQKLGQVAALVTTLAMPILVQAAHILHDVDGITGPTFTLTAKTGYLSTPEGGSLFFWGYANGGGIVQYPGPTLIVNQGDNITVTLNNELAVNTSLVFPGQKGVKATGGTAGLVTREAAPGGAVTYTFTAHRPGTYMYHSGTRPDLQTEMGLVGALIIRPAGYDPVNSRRAYQHSDTTYEHEFLFFLTSMDPTFHEMVEQGKMDEVDTSKFWSTYWFINGRNGPDTVLPVNYNALPNQPYDALVLVNAGDKVLMRVVGAGRESHPFHHHGNNSLIIARDGRLLESAPGAGPDLACSVFTIPSHPGATYDALFSWTGEKLGWDAYGHAHDLDNLPTGNFPGPEDVDHNKNGVMDVIPLAPNEYEPDHGKPFPVILPTDQNLTFGQFYSGSPFLGSTGTLPPGEGGFNPVGGFMYMWHSHSEKELCNNNIFPGGMLTFMIIAAHPNE